MAIFHCSIKIISRSDGRSAVACAAYRAAEKLTSQYSGITSNYTKKGYVQHTEIILPTHAPPEYRDRNTLWNAVETAEKSRNARLAREFELALPIELSDAQRIELGRKFAQQLAADGMCCDIAYHNPPVRNDLGQLLDADGVVITNGDRKRAVYINPHLHIMTTIRPLSPNGTWEAKSQKVYLCVNGNAEKEFTADEFKAAKSDGREKQYLYQKDNEQLWLPASDGKRLNLKDVEAVLRFAAAFR